MVLGPLFLTNRIKEVRPVCSWRQQICLDWICNAILESDADMTF